MVTAAMARHDHRINKVDIHQAMYSREDAAKRSGPQRTIRIERGGLLGLTIITRRHSWDVGGWLRRLPPNFGRWMRFMPSLPTERTREEQIL